MTIHIRPLNLKNAERMGKDTKIWIPQEQKELSR